MTAPLVSVVVPAREEASDITDCIDAIAAQDIGASAIELIVVDGASGDDTARIAQRSSGGHRFARVKILNNPVGSTPSSLNIGLSEVTTPIFCRVDARSIIPVDYVRRCVERLADPSVAAVGGAQVAIAAPGASPIGRGVARALRNPYATGLARYRRRRSSGPGDTTYLGAYRTEQLRAVNGWDERFATNQDYELNTRIHAMGSIWFEADLEVGYRPRPTFAALARQYRRFGRWKAAAWLESDVQPAARQIGLLAIPPAALVAALVFLHRWPVPTAAVAGPLALALDATTGEPAGPIERCAAVGAIVVFSASWWCGVAEQFVRHRRGERLLSQPAVPSAPPR